MKLCDQINNMYRSAQFHVDVCNSGCAYNQHKYTLYPHGVNIYWKRQRIISIEFEGDLHSTVKTNHRAHLVTNSGEKILIEPNCEELFLVIKEPDVESGQDTAKELTKLEQNLKEQLKVVQQKLKQIEDDDKTPETLCNRLILKTPDLFPYLPVQYTSTCIYIIRENPEFFKYIKEKTPTICKLAIELGANDIISYIHKPSKELKRLAIKHHWDSIFYMGDLDQELYLYAVERYFDTNPNATTIPASLVMYIDRTALDTVGKNYIKAKSHTSLTTTDILSNKG
jgi:hypothetical protein